MKPVHALEAALARSLAAGLRALPRGAARVAGVRLGDLARALGLRRRVAEENLARAFAERDATERAGILTAHYRELGRVVAEYARLPELARAPEGEVITAVRGLEHLLAARAAGRGALLLSGHYGNFELMGAYVGRFHPVDFLVQPLSNPGVEEWVSRQRAAAGVGRIPLGGVRRVFEALRANRWVALVADQDARRHGVFVPFLGRAASTPAGPARVALATGAPLITGFVTRRADGRMEIDVEPPLTAPDPHAPEAVVTLTALHVARLERWVRLHPEMWFWLHRRWKTRPPAEGRSACTAS